MSISYYTDQHISFIRDCKKIMTWNEVVDQFNKQFDTNKTPEALKWAWQKYKNTEFSDDFYLKKTLSEYRTKKINAKTGRENKILLEHISQFDDFKKELEKIVSNINFKVFSPPKIIPKKINGKTIVLHLSDTHYGTIVSFTQTGGVSEYNEKIAARRTAYLFDQVVRYADPGTELCLVINGDLICGTLHSMDQGELLSKQFLIALTILGQGISFLAQHFSKVTVRVTTGNHDRFVIGADQGRVIVNKFNSLATMCYYSLRRELSKFKNIDFVINEQPFLDFNIYKWRFYCTHGDSGFTVGNPGKALDTAKISAKINKLNNSDLIGPKKKKFDIFMIGHVHTPVMFLAENGETVLINGSLIGADNFSQSIGINTSRPTQQFVEVTSDHIGNARFCSLIEADNDSRFDKIISI